MKKLLLLFAAALLSLSANAANVITMTTSNAVGSSLKLNIQASGAVTIDGVSGTYTNGNQDYTLTAQTVTITGDVTTLNCSSNKLTALDVSQNTALTILSCCYNKLTTLDVSQNTALTTLNCGSNSLSALDVSHNTALTTLDCHSCQLKGAAMDALIASLPDRTGAEKAGTFVVVSVWDTEANQNICTTTQVAAAKAKNWGSYKNYYGSFIDYAGSEPTVISSVQASDGAEPAAIYDLSGRRIPQMRHGMNIVRMSNGQTKKVMVK